MAQTRQLFDALPAVLRTLRAQKGWTLGQAGGEAQVDVGNLSRYESGDTCPTLAVLSRLLVAYGTDVQGLADLLKSEPGPPDQAPPADPFVAAVRDAMVRLGYPPRRTATQKSRQPTRKVKPQGPS